MPPEDGLGVWEEEQRFDLGSPLAGLVNQFYLMNQIYFLNLLLN